MEDDLRRVVTQEGFAIREMRRTPDHAEAVRAFMEKREPRSISKAMGNGQWEIGMRDEKGSLEISAFPFPIAVEGWG